MAWLHYVCVMKPRHVVRLYRSTVVGIVATVRCTENKGVHYKEVKQCTCSMVIEVRTLTLSA